MFNRIDFPITATSANHHGEPELYDLGQITTQFGPDELSDVMIIDSPPLPARAPSTLLDMQVFPPRIIRSGPITSAAIDQAIQQLSPRR